MHDTSPLPRPDDTKVVHGPPAAPPSPSATPPAPRRRGGMRRLGELSAVAVLAAALASGGTAATMTLADGADSGTSGTAPSALPTGETLPVSASQQSSPDWEAVASTVAPSVVSIKVSGPQGQGQGSGVVVDDQGHILTNHHVAAGAGDGAELAVTFADGATYPAKVAGSDASTDLAVLTLSDRPKDLTPITLGSSDGLRVGDPVMAVGNPLGLSGTVTTGIVSALDRPVTTGDQSSPGSEPAVTNAVQTSAAINPGNSGGALVDAAGRLIGINSSIASLGGGQSGSIGIGFAIPVDTARMIADQLIADGSARHAFLGVTPQDATATVDGASRSGAGIASVSDGSAAAKGGLRQGDVVVAVGGTAVSSAESLVAQVRALPVGSTTELTVLRDGAERTVRVTLGERPTS